MSGIDYLAEQVSALAERVVERADGVDFMFGTVCSAAPIAVQVEQKLVIPGEMLVLTAAVVDMVAHENEETGEIYYVPEHNLQGGENVLLAKVRGGEAYVVLNRCYGMG